MLYISVKIISVKYIITVINTSFGRKKSYFIHELKLLRNGETCIFFTWLNTLSCIKSHYNCYNDDFQKGLEGLRWAAGSVHSH